MLTLCDFDARTQIDGHDSYSPFVMKAARALRHAKLPYEHRHVKVMDIKKLNPTGQLPVLLVDDDPVADSTAILHRIEKLAPGSMTGGLDARALGEAWLWEEFGDTVLYPFVLATRWVDDRGWEIPRRAFFGVVPAPIRGMVAAFVRSETVKRLKLSDYTRRGIDGCYDRLHGVLENLDARAPDEGFWMGAKPTAADISLFAQLHSLRLPQTEWTASAIGKRARLSAWLGRVDAATR